MNLYFVERTDDPSYDCYVDFVIACETEDEARNTHPRKNYGVCPHRDKWDGDEWVDSPDKLIVTHLGIANDGIVGIICAFYRAG